MPRACIMPFWGAVVIFGLSFGESFFLTKNQDDWKGIKEMEKSKIYSAVLRDTRWGYLLTLWLLVSLIALVVMLLRSKEGWWHPEEEIDQRGLHGTCGVVYIFVAISHSTVSISNTAGLCSSGHTEVSLLAVKHSSASCETGWSWFFPWTGRRKGKIFPMG